MTGRAMAADPLEATARWTAAARAIETARPDRLVDDPWAAALAGSEGLAWLEQRPEGSALPMVIRTRFFDDWLGRVAADDIGQFVLLAAGLDTRAYRLAWPAGTTVFELDRPAVLEHKATVLGAAGAVPACTRHAVEVDLSGEWTGSLLAARFDPGRPAAWLLEGFLFYVPEDAIERTLDAIGRLAAPGSQLAFDIVNGEVLTSPWTRPWIEMQAAAGAPWLGTMDDPVAFLAKRGWTASLTQPGEPGAEHGRWALPVPPAGMPGVPHSWYVTAHRQR